MKATILAAVCTLLIGVYGCTSVYRSSESKTPISTPSPDLQVKIISTELQGDEFVMDFTITNTGATIDRYYLYGTGGNFVKSKAYDDKGNSCEIELYVDKKGLQGDERTLVSLKKNTPLEVRATITGFDPDVSLFSHIIISGESERKNDPATGDFVFSGVRVWNNGTSNSVIFTE